MKILYRLTILITIALMISASTLACTSYITKTTDGYAFYTRTMEFGSTAVFNSMRIIPAGTKFAGSLPDGSFNGMKWANKYAYVGMMFNTEMPVVADGMNEKGLSGGMLLFPGYGVYQEYQPNSAAKTIAHWDVLDWILGSFSSLQEVRNAISNIRVCEGNKIHSGNVVLPLHYIVHDKAGNSLVLEYSDGSLHIFDDPIGILTNSPTFDWMMTYVKNFPNISPNNANSAMSGSGFGEGTGMLGLPGDYTPPGRFVRIAALTQSALPVTGADAGLNLAMIIIDNVQIPVGCVRDVEKTYTAYDQAVWTVVADMGQMRYYYRTYHNRDWHYVDLNQAFTGLKAPTVLKLEQPVEYRNVNPR